MPTLIYRANMWFPPHRDNKWPASPRAHMARIFSRFSLADVDSVSRAHSLKPVDPVNRGSIDSKWKIPPSGPPALEKPRKTFALFRRTTPPLGLAHILCIFSHLILRLSNKNKNSSHGAQLWGDHFPVCRQHAAAEMRPETVYLYFWL